MERTPASLSDSKRVPLPTRDFRPTEGGSLLSQRRQVVAQRELATLLNQGPRMAAQRKALAGLFGTVQRVEENEELPEEELLKARFETAQKMESEEDEPAQLRADHDDRAPLQRKNETGLPDNLKSGVESLSGISMDQVRVHYNSPQPAQLNALAYAQGTDIHVAPGQEQHLPHEAWHVVQQAQGRVRATMQMKSGVAVNDDRSLELEADQMGARAIRTGSQASALQARTALPGAFDGPVQLLADETALWDAYNDGYEVKLDPATRLRRDAQWIRWLQIYHNFEAALYAAKAAGGGAAYNSDAVQDRYDALMAIGIAVPIALRLPADRAADRILGEAATSFSTFRGDGTINRGAWAGSHAFGGQPHDYVQTSAAVIDTLRQRQVAAGGRLGNWWLNASDSAPSGWAVHRGAVDGRGDFIYHL